MAPRTGRPPLFRRRKRLVVYLEDADARRLLAAARRAGSSASNLARTLVLEGLARFDKKEDKR